MTMPAGKYYVGDLCYVLHERWDEFCDITISGHNCLDGEHAFKDGTLFASYGTKWGDGGYFDQNGREYSVDAGLIGCVKLDDINLEADGNFLTGGQVIEFDKPFNTYSVDGKIWFGDLVIDTDPSYEDIEEDYAEGDEY